MQLHMKYKISVKASQVFFYLLSFLLLTASISGCARQSLSKLSNLPNAQISSSGYQPIQPVVWNLSNGLTILFLEDNELPLIQGSLYVKGGSLWESPEKIGSTVAMGSQLREGGAGDLEPAELDVALDRLSSNITASFSGEIGQLSFACLDSDFQKVFDIFADVTLRPRFASERLNLWKGQQLEAIKRRVEDGDTVAQIAFNQLLYGDHPLGRIIVDGDIKKLTRSDLLASYQKLVRPNNSILAISGRISESKLREEVERRFALWQPSTEDLADLPAVVTNNKPAIYFIELPFSQSTILMGHLGVPRLTPDYAAIDLFNNIFGASGFGTRLMGRIRTELGLAYGVYGVISPGIVQGKNLIMLQTKSESAAQAIIESISELKKIQTQEVEYSELNESQISILNSFIFKFDSIEKSLQRQAMLRILNYPLDYDTTYSNIIAGLSAADVKQVARQRWDISKFVVVVVGDKTSYTAIQSARNQPNSVLSDLDLIKVRFDQKLQLQ